MHDIGVVAYKVAETEDLARAYLFVDMCVDIVDRHVPQPPFTKAVVGGLLGTRASGSPSYMITQMEIAGLNNMSQAHVPTCGYCGSRSSSFAATCFESWITWYLDTAANNRAAAKTVAHR